MSVSRTCLNEASSDVFFLSHRAGESRCFSIKPGDIAFLLWLRLRVDSAPDHTDEVVGHGRPPVHST